jgi:DNA-binding transcriptional LysR family regulator
VTQAREIDSGKLRLIVHPMLMSETFSRLVQGYHAIAPNVSLIVSVQDGAANLYDGRFDMAILPPHLVEQSAVIRRTLSKSPRIFVAAPAYLEQYGKPQVAAELAHHFLLLDADSRKKGAGVINLLERGTRVSVSAMSSIEGNEILLRAAALTGTGIAALPQTMVREDIDARRLTHILPQCTTSESKAEICLFYSHRELLPARFRAFVDFCTEFFRSPGHHGARDAEIALPARDHREDYEMATV